MNDKPITLKDVQQVGYKDISGREICVGDIIRYQPDRYDFYLTGDIRILKSKGVVMHIDKCEEEENGEFIRTYDFPWRGYFYPRCPHKRALVIGNVHDNKDLLEEK